MRKLLLFLFVLSLWNCSPKSRDNGYIDALDQNVVKIDGSSVVYAITKSAAEQFNERNKEIKIALDASDTGVGFNKFMTNEIDIVNASRPIKEIEDNLCKAAGIEYLELPIAYDGLALIVNSTNDWVDYLTVGELKKMWESNAQGKITRWNQIRPNWPKEELHLFGAGAQSGTFNYFTEAVIGNSKASRKDYTASEDDHILMQHISKDKLALGFVTLDHYLKNKEKLKLIPIDDQNPANGLGPVLPSQETMENATYQPLSRLLFIYVNKESLKKTGVDNFVKFLLANTETLAMQSGYFPLTNAIYSTIKKKFEQKKTGSSFLHARHQSH